MLDFSLTLVLSGLALLIGLAGLTSFAFCWLLLMRNRRETRRLRAQVRDLIAEHNARVTARMRQVHDRVAGSS